MSRFTLLTIFTFALLALTASAAPNTERCSPIKDLYKDWVKDCTQNNAAIPNSDADPRWKPCICKDGFYPLALAAENCQNNNNGNQLTPESLTALCNSTAGFIPPLSQKAPDNLPAALASVTSIIASQPTPTGSPSSPDSAAAGLSSSPAILYSTLMTIALVAAGYAF